MPTLVCLAGMSCTNPACDKQHKIANTRKDSAAPAVPGAPAAAPGAPAPAPAPAPAAAPSQPAMKLTDVTQDVTQMHFVSQLISGAGFNLKIEKLERITNANVAARFEAKRGSLQGGI